MFFVSEKTTNKYNSFPLGIDIVTNKLLCSGCGACAAICPKGAINMRYNPAGFLYAHLNHDLCIDCGKCTQICPSTGKEKLDIMREPLLTVSGYAKDEAIRKRGQSGGVVTALLVHLIESGIVDGAVVTRLKNGNPETIYTEDISEIKQSSGSVYAQTAVAEIALKTHGKRMAIVALGCQAKAIRKAIIYGRKDLNESIIIGLICGGNMSLHMKEALIKKEHRKLYITDFCYRDKENTGWPGAPSYCIGKERVIRDNSERLRLKPVYECYRCVVCPDKMNPMCDIAVGDPWGIEEDQDKNGVSVAIAYTDKGFKLLSHIESFIQFREIEVNRVLGGQRIVSDYYNRLLQLNGCSNEFPVPFSTTLNATINMTKKQQEKLRWDRKVYRSSTVKGAKNIRQRALHKEFDIFIEKLYLLKQNIVRLANRNRHIE